MQGLRQILTAILFLIICATANAQQHELHLGLRDTYFARLGWKMPQGFIVGGEMSMFNSAERNQIGRLYAGYEKKIAEVWNLSAESSFALNFEGRYRQAGLKLYGQRNWKWLSMALTAYPNYDSQLRMQWDGEIEASGHILSDLDLCVSYGNIPEYREDLKYVRIGLLFKTNKLWVKPMVNLPDVNNEHLRIIVSLGWKFEFDTK